jgi:hypothetical protein
VPDSAEHDAAQERLFDCGDRERAQQSLHREARHGRAVHAGLPGAQSHSQHHGDHRQHERHAQYKCQRELAQEHASRHAVTEARPIGEPEPPRDAYKANRERQHADAGRDAMERKTKIRMQDEPRRVGEKRHGREGRDQQP